MSVSKQIDVLVMYYLTSHQVLEFILGWLTGIHNVDELAKYVNLPNLTEDNKLIEAFCNKAGCSSLLKKQAK